MKKQIYQFSYFFRELYLSTRQVKIQPFKPKQPKIKISYWPSFIDLDLEFVHTHFDYSMNLQVQSPFRWTPLLQIQQQSQEFLKKMVYFQRLKLFKPEHQKEIMDTFIFEALKNTDFDYYYDYSCSASDNCLLHGKIDFLIYHKYKQLPLIPVIRVIKRHNVVLDMMEDHWNKAHVGQWIMKNTMLRNPELTHVNVIQTNGNKWKMIRLSTNGDYQETGLYFSKKNEFEKIYFDFEEQKVVLGLIKFSLDAFSDKEKSLHSVYQLIDDRRYLTDLDETTKAQLDRNYKFWWFLPKKVREFFFKY